MLHFAKIYFLIMGLVLLAGGVMGYVKARSVASLVAGAVSGALLLVSWYLLPDRAQAGLIIACIVCLGLAGRFVPALLRGKMMPAGYVAPLAVAGIIVSLVLLLRAGGHSVP